MHPFHYLAAADVATAIAAKAAYPKAAFVAGGTALIDLMKLGAETPEVLIDVGRLPLTGIETEAGGLRVGALVRNADLVRHKTVRRRFPLLSQALLSGASPQLRNMATVGGNLLQRTRCSYFRDVHLPCNKRSPGSGCGALHGHNRLHAVLGASEHCIAVHPSDLAVALVALDAVVRVCGPAEERELRLEDFYLLPGRHPEHETLLRRDELIVAVQVPALDFAARSLYLKARDRASYAFALVSVAAALDLDGDVIRNARAALGGIAPKPWRAREAEAVLIGSPATDETFRAAAQAVLDNAVPQAHNGFKLELIRRLLVRVFGELTEQARREQS